MICKRLLSLRAIPKLDHLNVSKTFGLFKQHKVTTRSVSYGLNPICSLQYNGNDSYKNNKPCSSSWFVCRQMKNSRLLSSARIRYDEDMIPHPFDPLSSHEIVAASNAVRESLSDIEKTQNIRFVAVSLAEPCKEELKMYNKIDALPTRKAEVIILNPETGCASELVVLLSDSDGKVNNGVMIESRVDLPPGVQPMFTPEDCDLAEEIVKANPVIQEIVKERYGIQDIEQELVCDPWSVHLSDDSDLKMVFNEETKRPRRLIQTFLYQRMYGEGLEDNHYAHPIDITPVVDLNTGELVQIDGLDSDATAPQIPKLSVNYHRNLLSTNSYLSTAWREDKLKQLNIVQPDGPSFSVDGNLVKWQNWSFRVGFNYREGLVLHDVKYANRPIMTRASLVEMAVPYGEPSPPYQRKCAFDVGDYGLGYCANSLELGCDCLGHIHYFDATLSDIQGQAKTIKKAICMHEEDSGLLWKHVEYRNGHNESRRGRELIISSIATVVNYEYLFYWKLKMDGSIEFEIKLTGELSTNLSSVGNQVYGGTGFLVAPGVNAQVHQHMFCMRLDMAVDGDKNTVSEVDVVMQNDGGTYGNAFGPKETLLTSEQNGIRTYDATKARAWKISNAEGKLNPITQKPVAYKLIPFTIGAAQPTLLTSPECTVTTKGQFSTANLWVTPYDQKERFPAGEYPTQGDGSNGLPDWTSKDRNILGEDLVVWHSFGVSHVPRVEDFPVMPVETTGFMLKPDGFFAANPAIDLEPDNNTASVLAKGCCSK